MLFYKWVGSVIGAGALTSFVAAVAIVLSWGFASIGVGSLVGLSIGLAQVSLLKRVAPKRDWSTWTAFSMIGATLAWIFGLALWILPLVFLPSADRIDRISPVMLILGTTIFCGTLFGASQWLILRKWLRNSGLWVVANSIGTAAGGIAGISVSLFIYSNILPWDWKGDMLLGPAEGLVMFVSGTVGIVPFAVVTGFALTKLIRQPRETSDFAPGD